MKKTKAEVVVLGAGPGGYTAAFHAADRGKKVLLVNMEESLGGVCLNRGCIPSKALLHAAEVMESAAAASEMGLSFSAPKLNLSQLRKWKSDVVAQLSKGVRMMADKRKIEVMIGRGHLEDSTTLRVETKSGQKFIEFEQLILAVGSRPALPHAFDLGNKRIMTSTEALDLADIPKTLLVVGGGYIGMELGTVYATLGAKVTVVEATDSLLTGADADLVRPVKQYAEAHFESVLTEAKVSKMATKGNQIEVSLVHEGKTKKMNFDKVLVSVGRTPNTADLGLDNTKVKMDERGYVLVNNQQQTSDPTIYAIGDVAGGLLLAHKAYKEARVAVEAICGEGTEFAKDTVIPAVVFTHPEVAWCGLTESEAKAKGIAVKVSKFPWSANGRALTIGAKKGLTKLIIDPSNERVLGVGIVGPNAGDMISEGALAIEMRATVRDLALTVHPHPTLSETIMEAAQEYCD